MSLADRPRPTLVLVRSILKGNMFAFVWLPRDELTTRRRLADRQDDRAGLAAAGSPTGRSSWATATSPCIRYTLYVGPETPTPDVAELDRRLDEMVRGWEPAVEEALGELVGPAARHPPRSDLSSTISPRPTGSRVPPAEAAQDILRICDARRRRASATPGSTARRRTGRSG